MARFLVGRGTLLNTTTVAVGAAVGLAVGRFLPDSYGETARAAIGLVVVGLGIKMFLETRSVLVVVAAMACGSLLGHLVGIQAGLVTFAEWAKQTLGAQDSSTFAEAVVTTSVLYCAGPMTLLGCVQDALEDKIELLAIKSALDGIGSVFFAATLGPGVLVSAGVVLVVQGLITASASPLKPLAAKPAIVAEVTSCGGAILLGIGLGLLGVVELPFADYLGALIIAPVLVSLANRLRKESGGASENP